MWFNQNIFKTISSNMTNCTESSTLGTWQEEWNQRLLSPPAVISEPHGFSQWGVLCRGGALSILHPSSMLTRGWMLCCHPTNLNCWLPQSAVCSAGILFWNIPVSLCHTAAKATATCLLIIQLTEAMVRLWGPCWLGGAQRYEAHCDPVLWDNLPSQQQEPLSFRRCCHKTSTHCQMPGRGGWHISG